VGKAQAVALAVESAGDAEVLWVVESGRLLRLDPAAELREVLTAPTGERLLCAMPAADGLWLGTSGGLWLLAGKEPRRVWSAAGVLTVHPEPGGLLLVGTDGRGVERVRAK
jgi:hypothetical protein